MRASQSPSAPGFSVLELLITVGIIATLAALIVPGVKTVLVKAKTTQCLSNLRHCGLGFAGFMQDNNGRFPPYGNTPDGQTDGAGRWAHTIAPYMGFHADYTTKLGLPAYKEAYRSPIFHCSRTPFSAYSANNGSVNGLFGINPYFQDPNTETIKPTMGIVYVSLQHPSQTVLMAEKFYLTELSVNPGDSGFSLAPNTYPNNSRGASANHRYDGKPGNYNPDDPQSDGTTNYLFADGHAKTLRQFPGKDAFTISQN